MYVARFVCVFVILHLRYDYNIYFNSLYFNGDLCYTVSYYNYNFIFAELCSYSPLTNVRLIYI